MNRAWPPILIWLVCLLAAGGWVGHVIQVDHDLAAFLPDRDRPIETLLISRANQGVVSRTALAAFAGGTLDRRLAASREAADRLGQIGGVERVLNGGESLDLGAFDALFAYRYLLADPPPMDASALRRALEARLRELRSPLGAGLKATLDQDPTASFRNLLLAWSEEQAAPRRQDGLWVTADGERALLIAVLAEADSEPGDEANGVEAGEIAVIAAIRTVLSETASAHGVELLLAGRPVLIDEARESVRASLVVGSIAAGGLVVLLLLWVYRSPGVLLLGVLPPLSGVTAGLFAVLLLFGPVHGIALAFGATLLGITLDYPLHLFSHGRHGEPMTKTAKDIQRPLLLGALTTAGAFAIFGTSSAPGLGQLACFTGAGILAAAFTLRWVIPHLAGLARIEPSPRTVDWLPARPCKGLTWLIVILGVAALALLISRHDRLFETDVGVLNPLPEASKLLDQRLRSDLGAPDLRHLLLIEAKEVETVLRQGERLAPALEELREKGAITGFDSPARYLSSRALQERRRAALPSAGDLEAALTEAQEDLPFKAGAFDPFLKSVEDSRTLPSLGGEQGLALFDATPLGARVSQLLLADEGRWYGFVPMSGVADVAGLRALADQTNGVELIDLKSLSEGVLSVFRDEAFTLLALGSGVILLLLAAFRYPLSGIARIFLTLALSIVITMAMLSLAGEKLTMLHILAALLVVGLGLDYTIFFSWPDADEQQRSGTRHALLVCMASTVLVFGLLAGSAIDLLRAIGLTVALGACTTFAAAYAILSRHDD